jgi:integrase
VRHALQRVKRVLRHVELKTDASRRLLALPPTLVEAMLRHRERQESERVAAGPSWRSTGFVITTVKGEPLDGTTVTHSFQRLLRRVGLPRMRFYDLRHGCASLLLAEGVHPRVVMETLGHSGIGLTMNTYSHVSAAFSGRRRTGSTACSGRLARSRKLLSKLLSAAGASPLVTARATVLSSK